MVEKIKTFVKEMVEFYTNLYAGNYHYIRWGIIEWNLQLTHDGLTTSNFSGSPSFYEEYHYRYMKYCNIPLGIVNFVLW